MVDASVMPQVVSSNSQPGRRDDRGEGVADDCGGYAQRSIADAL